MSWWNRPIALIAVVLAVTSLGVAVQTRRAHAQHLTFSRGDLFVSLRTGEVQWRNPDGSLNMVLVNTVPGKAEGMGFDAAGNLYVSHYCADLTVCRTGNSVEVFNPQGISMGSFGSHYDCNPESVGFDAVGHVYVGQSDCTGNILRFDSLGNFQLAFPVAWENRGSTRIDLAPDGCTMFYTSQGPNVKRYNVCTGQQLSDFNTQPAPPEGNTYGLRVLPDGGVLVAMISYIARLYASGNVIHIYSVPNEPGNWWLGVDLVGDGTFWASNYVSSNVYRFDLATGAILNGFNAGTPTTMVKDVLVKR